MFHQLRYTIRGFVSRPAFAAALIISVALGLGGNAVVLGFMNGLVSHRTPLPPAPGLPVTVLAQHADGGLGLLSVAQFEAVRQSQLFETVVAVVETRNAVRLGDRSAVASVATVSSDAVPFFGLPKGDGVVLSADFVARELTVRRPRPDERIILDGTAYAVAGVAPRALDGVFIGRPIDIWRRADPAPVPAPTLSVLGRLRPDVTLREAQRALQSQDEAADLVVADYTGLAPDMQAAVRRLRRLLPAVAGAVFLIACANVAVLLLSRAARESRDTAVRMALGATRLTLARAAMIGAAVIAAAGAAAGVLVAVWTLDVVPALLFAPDAEWLSFVADRDSIILSTVLSALVIVACGAAPILENRRDAPARALSREADRPSRALSTLRKALVVLQTATCCVLVIAAFTVSEALSASLRTAAGQRLDTTILVTVASRHDYRRPDLGLQYFRGVEKTLRDEPGISLAAWTAALPGSRPAFQVMTVEPPALPRRRAAATVSVFTRESLDRVELPPVQGRMFGGGDTRATCRVAVVSASAAGAFFGERAVGRVLTEPGGNAIEIIGVFVPKTKAVPRSARPVPDVYYYAEQEPIPFEGREMAFEAPVLPPPVTAMLDVRVVSPAYFELMGLARVAGEIFGGAAAQHACRVGVVNEAAAHLYFGGTAVGGALIDAGGRRTAVVGVVRDANLRATQRRQEPALYVPLEQEFVPRMNLLLASTDPGEAVRARLLRRVRSVDGGDAGAIAVLRLDDRLRQTALASERIAQLLLTISSLNALALALVGLCRITADDVLERQREMAVRSALGAQGWRLVALVLRRAARIAALGIFAGILASLLFVRWVGAVTGLDTAALDWTWIAGPAVIAIATLTAALWPARRILRLDPLTAMRAE